jgi:hypothetical protein
MRTKVGQPSEGGNVVAFCGRDHESASAVSRRDPTIPQSHAGAVKPRARSASCMTTNVSAGNFKKPFQLKAAPYLRPVKSATAGTPPRASITSAVVVSSRGCASMDSANSPNFLDLQHPNLIDTKKFGHAPSCQPMASAGTDDDDDVAIRCRVLTLLYAKGNSSAFADLIGVSPTRWNNIEGNGALSRDMARKIVRRFPEVSLDWLIRGRTDALTQAKSEELAGAFKRLVGTTPETQKRKRAAS